MKKIFFIILLTGAFSIAGFAQENTKLTIEPIPADFKSDGCSRFPDGDYVECCVEHDKAYFVGGSWKCAGEPTSSYTNASRQNADLNTN